VKKRTLAKEASASPEARIIGLDRFDLHSGSIVGVPDLAATRWICFGMAMMCLALAIALPALTILVRPGPNLDPGAVAVAMVVGALILIPAFLFARSGLRVGAWVRVDATGIHYGQGRGEGGQGRYGSADIEWSRIVANGSMLYDVRLILDGAPHIPKQARIGFWYRSADGIVTERSVPMALRETGMQCLRFVNADAVRIVMLKRMAACPGLRFDPAIFIEAGVDPETWQAMRKPHGIEWIIVGISMAVVLMFGSLGSKTAPLMLVGGVFAALGAGLVATIAFRRAAYPDLRRAIRFRPED